MSLADVYAARLHAMVDDPAQEESETRGLENPTFAVNPAQLDSIWGYGPTRSGVQINESTSLTVSAVWAAVRVISDSIGMLPIGIFRGDDDEDVKVRARDHEAYDLLRSEPNPEMSAITFKQTVMANLALWGNGYARILSKNSGAPAALLPLESSRTYPERRAGQLIYTVVGKDGCTLFPEEVIHLPGLTLNGIKGLSPIAYNREAIATGKAAEIYGATLFGNSGVPKGVLEVPGILKPETQAALRESWNAMHAGVGNAHKTAILQGGTTFKALSIPPEDAQFLATRTYGVGDIARIFNVPPHRLGLMDRATHSNIEQAALEFLLYCLLPWIEQWEQECTRKLCGSKGDFHVKFDVNRLLRTDTTARLAYYVAARQWGWMSANDVLAKEGQPPLPGDQGNAYFAPVNMMPEEAFAKMTSPSGTQPGGATPPKVAPGIGLKALPGPGANGNSARSAEILAGVFEDAIGRMLRKEANARSRGNADEAFYAEHAKHVEEALRPATVALLEISGLQMTREHATVLSAFARERHESDDREIASIESMQLINDLLSEERGGPGSGPHPGEGLKAIRAGTWKPQKDGTFKNSKSGEIAKKKP